MTDGTKAEDEALALMRADGFGRSGLVEGQPIAALDHEAIGASLYGTRPGDESEAEPVVVTDDMLWAGYQADDGIELTRDDFTALCPGWREDMTKVYRAMAAVEPLVPNLHARLTADRAAALARAEAAEKALFMWQDATIDLRKQLEAADDTQPQTDVDRVLDQLDRRVVGAPERKALRGALDRADAPDKSRTGQDAAVGRVTPKSWGFR